MWVEPGRGGTNGAQWRRHRAETGDRGAGRRAAGEEPGLRVSAAAMATVDLEKLRMSGAGKAIGVLTSGGDAQGDGGAKGVFTDGSGVSGCPQAPSGPSSGHPGIGGQSDSCGDTVVWF